MPAFNLGMGTPARVGTPESKPVYTSRVLEDMAARLQASPAPSVPQAAGPWTTVERLSPSDPGMTTVGGPGGGVGAAGPWISMQQGLGGGEGAPTDYPGNGSPTGNWQYGSVEDPDIAAQRQALMRQRDQMASLEGIQQSAYDQFLRPNTNYGRLPSGNFAAIAGIDPNDPWGGLNGQPAQLMGQGSPWNGINHWAPA